MTEYEYGIEWRGTGLRDPEGPHRTGMTEDEARAWIDDDDWPAKLDDRLVPLSDEFKIVRRPIGPWEDLPDG